MTEGLFVKTEKNKQNIYRRNRTMKMIIAVINNDDSVAASAALSREGFWVTKLSTTGGYLMVGNSTFLIGTDDDKVDKAISGTKRHRSHRAFFGKIT